MSIKKNNPVNKKRLEILFVKKIKIKPEKYQYWYITV